MQFTVLGPVEVTNGGRQVAVGGARQRRLLCSLLAAQGEVVSVDRLAEEIWDDDERPQEPARAVRSYVARLRRALGDRATVILTKAPGYLFDAGDNDVDASEFELLVESAEERATPHDKADVLRSALGLWRGRAYDEFADLEWIRPEVERLERLRAAATEDLFEAELAQGARAQLIPDLELEVERFPFNERLRGLLAEALWRAGRPVDAVRSLQGFRDFLAEETALEPSEHLQLLERSILAGVQPDGDAEVPAGNAQHWPSGIVTVLMADIVDSEKLWAQNPSGMDESVELYDALIHGLVEAGGGVLVRATTDQTLAVFQSPVDAATVAVKAQLLLNSQDWSVGDLPVRMGIHAGVAHNSGGNYRGPVVNGAARLTSAGGAGYILVSSIVAELISDTEHTLRDLGSHRLEDLTVAEHLWQIVIPGLETTADLLHTTKVVAGNLPAQTTSFVGRQSEIDELVEVLQKARLLTLTGPGGSGKTRLAMQVAREVSSRFAGGVWLVDLSAVRESHLVADAIVETFGWSRTDQRTATDLVVSALGFSPVLLILDTCENVIDGVAELVDRVLSTCGDVTIIATSREVLDLPAETARVVGSLGPDAVELFRDRAATTTAAFALTTENLGLVEEICSRLDGIPLAIELAASRVGALDLGAIAAGVDGSLRVLGGRGRGRAKRHQTLERTIAWSHEALDPIDRSLFDRLSVFGDSFTTSSVQGTCTDRLVTAPDIGDRLERLAGKSMIEIHASSAGRRFRLLDTLRTFGKQRLDEADECDQWRARHANHYASSVHRMTKPQWSGQLQRPAEVALLRQLTAESANIRCALDYALDRNDLDTAAGLLLDVGAFLRHLGVTALAVSAERMLELEGLDAHPRACSILHEIAMHQFLGLARGHKALRTVKRGLAISETPLLISFHGTFTNFLGDAPEYQPDCERGWQLALSQGDKLAQLRVAAPMIYNLAVAGNVELAMQRWHQMSELAHTYPAPTALRAHIDVAAIVFADHDPELARRALETARDVAHDLGLRTVVSRARANLAQLALKTGRTEEALAAAVRALTDDFDSGTAQFEVVSWMHRVVVILAHLGQTESSVILHHALPAVGVWFGDEPAEHMLAARRTLGARVYDQAVERGRASTLPELVDWLRTLPVSEHQ